MAEMRLQALRAGGIGVACVLLGSLITACGGGGATPPHDGGPDAASDASLDSSTTDSGGLCSADLDCDDGLFCDGTELCRPTDTRADANGCMPAEAVACVDGQTCDEARDLCQTMCDLSGDADGDGHDALDCGGDDCDDGDAMRYPGNVEVCDADGHDEDCDPTTLGADEDGDGHVRLECCNPQADGTSLCGDDCDDGEITVNPEALEVCDGDVDNDCNGLADADDGVCVPCPAGYRGFDDACTNIDECAEGAPCGGADGVSCTDTPGSYICSCPPGYMGDASGGTCVDDNECATGIPCGGAATACNNTPGSYSCECLAGYTAPATGGTCADVDECLVASTCGSQRAGCTNLLGSYRCTCTSGYEAPAMGGTCGSTDQCGTGDPCGSHKTSCTNTPGSYQCICAAGYSAPATGGTCADLNECATATTCGSGRSACTNLPGTYQCFCDAGYSAPASGGSCSDIDECATATTCGSARTGCANTPGSYSCTCAGGYSAPASGGTCTDINECASGSTCGGARTGCANTAGSYSCTCAGGYSAPASGGTCTDVNECASGSTCGSARTGCTNTVGSYSCSCASGYSAPANGGTCTDTDECALGLDDCDTDPSAACSNTPTASFTCTCPASFTGTGHDASGCGLNDARLLSLVPTAGALSPSFSSGTLAYYLGLPRGTSSVRLTPTIAYPGHATITIQIGAAAPTTVASGAASPPITVSDPFATVDVTVTVTTELSVSKVYSVRVGRASIYIKPSNTGASDEFGGVAVLSSDGRTLAVGARYEDSNATGIGGSQSNNTATNSGAVYVFTRTGATWTQQAYIKASNTNADDQFGAAIALSPDGSRLAVGAPLEDSNGVGGSQTDNSRHNAGAVYVFARSGGTWTQQAYVKAAIPGADALFGSAVALSSSILAVGCPRDNVASVNAGAVYVFSVTGSTWSQQALLLASNANEADVFGTAVEISSDGLGLAVGAPGEGSCTNGNPLSNGCYDAGAVYTFTRAGSVWTEQSYLKATSPQETDRFGQVLALADDFSTLATSVDGYGVLVFARSGGTWPQQARLQRSTSGVVIAATGDGFGSGLALSGDGGTLAIAAPAEDSDAIGIGGDQENDLAPESGAAYVFTRAGVTWSQRAFVKASNTDTNDARGVGVSYSVAMSADGVRLSIGAGGEDSSATGIGGDETSNATTGSGAIYVYAF